MQFTTKNDAESHRGISEALSKMGLETHKLCVQTRDLHHALRRTGPNCNTLRLLLDKQQGELGRAEVALAKRAREVSGSSGHAARRFEESEPLWGDCGNGVDDKIMALVQAHDGAAYDALAAARAAKEAHDIQSYKLLKRRADAHDVASWALGPMLITSVTACELCSARFTCPLRASLAKIGRRPSTERTPEKIEVAAVSARRG
jgi:DNA-binding ferritin-like protein